MVDNRAEGEREAKGAVGAMMEAPAAAAEGVVVPNPGEEAVVEMKTS